MNSSLASYLMSAKAEGRLPPDHEELLKQIKETSTMQIPVDRVSLLPLFSRQLNATALEKLLPKPA